VSRPSHCKIRYRILYGAKRAREWKNWKLAVISIAAY